MFAHAPWPETLPAPLVWLLVLPVPEYCRKGYDNRLCLYVASGVS